MSKLAFGAAVYFDQELFADARPLVVLWQRLATQPGLQSWTSSGSRSTKPVAFDAARLRSRIESGQTSAVGVESRDRAVAIVAHTAPAATLDRRPPTPRWRYDVSVSLSADVIAALGQDNVVDALCEFADAVAAVAGVIVWSTSLEFASALASLSSGPDLTRTHVAALNDVLLTRRRWGEVIRGPEWGTFLSAAHVATLGATQLPAAKTVPLASGGVYVQATDEPFDVEAPPPALAALRDALAPVRNVT